MNHWPFILAAYAATILLTAGLILWARLSMRRAEKRADELKRR
ncbi:MAG TPA: heme exporter protein CcmD [Sphingomicrobium sp.]|jgi:heme exporter protein CcmD|nr:heme exporter protein CcmD [Sphingomicrobium sp.]